MGFDEVLKMADASSEPGRIGEILRRYRLYSSHLTTWRRERVLGALERLDTRGVGAIPARRTPSCAVWPSLSMRTGV